MNTITLLAFCTASAVSGYATARLIDTLKRAAEREQSRLERQQTYLEHRRPIFHPSELLNIQERAELDDLRDYIRSKDA